MSDDNIQSWILNIVYLLCYIIEYYGGKGWCRHSIEKCLHAINRKMSQNTAKIYCLSCWWLIEKLFLREKTIYVIGENNIFWLYSDCLLCYCRASIFVVSIRLNSASRLSMGQAGFGDTTQTYIIYYHVILYHVIWSNVMWCYILFLLCSVILKCFIMLCFIMLGRNTYYI